MASSPRSTTGTARRLLGIARTRFKESDFSNTSILVSYYLLLALFPLVILVGNLLPYLAVSATTVLDYLRLAFPAPVWELVGPTIESLLTTPNPGLFLASLVAFGGAAVKAVQQLYNGLVKTYGIKRRPGFLASKAMAVLSIVAILISMLVFVFLFVFGEMLVNALSTFIPWMAAASSALWDARGLIAVLFLFVLLCLLYVLLPHGGLKLREVWPGAVCATVGLVVLSDTFALYVRFAANSLAIYGAISIFFVLMVWLSFSSGLLMFGTLVNATLREYRQELTGEDERREARDDAANDGKGPRKVTGPSGRDKRSDRRSDRPT